MAPPGRPTASPCWPAINGEPQDHPLAGASERDCHLRQRTDGAGAGRRTRPRRSPALSAGGGAGECAGRAGGTQRGGAGCGSPDMATPTPESALAPGSDEPLPATVEPLPARERNAGGSAAPGERSMTLRSRRRRKRRLRRHSRKAPSSRRQQRRGSGRTAAAPVDCPVVT